MHNKLIAIQASDPSSTKAIQFKESLEKQGKVVYLFPAVMPRIFDQLSLDDLVSEWLLHEKFLKDCKQYEFSGTIRQLAAIELSVITILIRIHVPENFWKQLPLRSKIIDEQIRTCVNPKLKSI